MRNCVVPRCDHKNKQTPKRAMFNVPVKDPDLLSMWQKSLPVQRPLKEFDRVCEQHFREEDVLRYWEHTINGTVERMERHKPALKPNSVPVYVEVEELVKTEPKRKQKKADSPGSRVKIQKLEQSTEENQPVESITVVKSTPDSSTGTIHLSIETVTESAPNQAGETDVIIEVAQVDHPDFETLYEEVYEVQLPSTLWGIHRDVEKSFVCFSEFSKETMGVRKYLFINRYLHYHMAVGVRVMKRGNLPSGSTESITDLLTKLDNIKVRKVIIKEGNTSILGS